MLKYYRILSGESRESGDTGYALFYIYFYILYSINYLHNEQILLQAEKMKFTTLDQTIYANCG